MKIQYPRWVPNPKTVDGLPEKKVETEVQHEAFNRADYEEEVNRVIPEPQTLAQIIEKAKDEECLRCAAIARDWPTPVGAEIAASILGLPVPESQQVAGQSNSGSEKPW